MNPTGNTILITGGGSGIGRELARSFHELGNRVIVAGRRREALDEVTASYPGIASMVLDVENADAIRDFAVRIVAEHPALNVLVNNAGIMRQEDLTADAFLADAEAMIATNVLGPIRLTAALLPRLRAQARSTIVNVTSGLAFVPLAATPTYSATKAAMHSYTLSLRHQLRDTAVEVIELAPPGVQTDLTPGQATREGYMPLADYIAETMALFARQPTPQEVLVERVKMLRNAEAEGRFDAVFGVLNH